MNKIKYKNIYAVPSIHYSPQFAKITKIIFDEVKPDVIAVELPSNCQKEVIDAVKLLPVLSAVYNNNDDNVYSFIPVIPTDSLIEAVRLGIELQIPVKFIDLNIPINIPTKNKPLLDDIAIETIGLKRYYNIVKNQLPVCDTKAANDLREELMTFHLQNLMKEYKTILFVCGMAHWERILNRFEKKNNFYNHFNNDMYNIGILDFKLLEYELGIFPYNAYFYEINRNNNSYEWLNCIYSLYKNSDKKKELSTKEIKDMILYCRNQSLLNQKIIPSLYQIILSAKQMKEDEYAVNVLALARMYKFQKKAKQYGFPIIKYNSDNMSALIEGKTKKIHLRIPNYNEQKKIGRIKTIKFKSNKRKHPFGKTKHVFDLSRWGRFGDEMKRETDFIFHLEKKWNEINNTADDYDSYKFTGGLMDGIDYRTIVRNVHRKNLFVKKNNDNYKTFSVVIFEFISCCDEKNYPWVEFCYQFGKTPKMFHYGFGITCPERNLNNGTGQYDWLYLASYKKDSNLEFVMNRCNECYQDYLKGDYVNSHEIIRHTAIDNAPGKNILIVGTDRISQKLKNFAKSKNKKIYFLNKNNISQKLVNKNFTFNIYYKAL